MLASVIRELIAPVLRECPRECGIVTITEVNVSSDASVATVLISALEHPEDALNFLKGERKSLHRELSKLPTFRMPKLQFRIDPRSARGSRIEELLKTEEEKNDK